MYYSRLITVYRAPSIRGQLENIIRSTPRCQTYIKWENVTRRMYQRRAWDNERLETRFRGEVADTKSITIAIMMVLIVGDDRHQMQTIVNNFQTVFDHYETYRPIPVANDEMQLQEFLIESLQPRWIETGVTTNGQRITDVDQLMRFIHEHCGERVTIEDLNRRTMLAGGVALEGLFHPAPRPEQPPSHSYSASVTAAMQNRNRSRNLVTRAMRESGQRRQEEARAQEWRIEWSNTHYWVSPDPDGNPVAWAVSDMTDQHLWKTVCWTVSNYVTLFNQYDEAPRDPSVPIGLLAGNWLRTQSIFRALVAEAIRRKMTFPATVFSFIRNITTLIEQLPQDDYSPWADPRQQHQIAALAPLVDMPIIVKPPVNAREEYGKDFRQLDLTDNDT